MLEFEPKGEHISIKATFKHDKISEAQAALLLQQLDSILGTFVQDAEHTIETLVCGMDQALLSITNPAPNYEVVPSRSLATVFEESVSRTPEAIAVQYMSRIENSNAISESISYADLNSSANQLARYLLHQGVQADDLIAICMEKSIVCYRSILAIVKAGAGYLPLTPDTPPERTKRILTDASVRFILCSEDIKDIALPDGVQRVIVKDLELDTLSTEDVNVDINANCLAYAIFTSGSTGVPKGVLVEHAQIVSNLDILAEMYPVSAGDSMLQFCAISFDGKLRSLHLFYLCPN